MTPVHALNTAIRAVPRPCVYCLGILPAIWLTWRGANGGLGAEPVSALEHELGMLALQLVVAALAVSPLRRVTGINLFHLRRAFGVLAFSYMVLHLTVWAVLDLRDPALILGELSERPYIMVGMLAFLMALPLAVTSNDRSVRRLGPGWRRLQRLVYPMSVVAAVHFVMVRKGTQIEPLIYLGLILALLALRWRPGRRRATA